MEAAVEASMFLVSSVVVGVRPSLDEPFLNYVYLFMHPRPPVSNSSCMHAYRHAGPRGIQKWKEMWFK